MFNVKNANGTISWVLLFVAIAITVLYLIFAEPIITTFYIGSDTFADSMYDYNLYFVLATLMSIVVWAMAALYYWVIDQVRLSSFVWWLLFGIAATAIVPFIFFYYPLGVFVEENLLDFEPDLVNFAIISLPLTIVYYFIISVCIKSFSTNCSTRPF